METWPVVMITLFLTLCILIVVGWWSGWFSPPTCPDAPVVVEAEAGRDGCCQTLEEMKARVKDLEDKWNACTDENLKMQAKMNTAMQQAKDAKEAAEQCQRALERAKRDAWILQQRSAEYQRELAMCRQAGARANDDTSKCVASMHRQQQGQRIHGTPPAKGVTPPPRYALVDKFASNRARVNEDDNPAVILPHVPQASPFNVLPAMFGTNDSL